MAPLSWGEEARLPLLSPVVYFTHHTKLHGAEMLDSFIIQRIRQERESRETSRIPLRIEDHPPRRPSAEQGEEEKPERGVAIIDFTI